MRVVLALVCAACSSDPPPCPPATSPIAEPTVPVGYDAYRMWDRWPYLRLGTRTYMRSTYDRTGGNEGADASHFVRLEPDRAIALDVHGPGVLYFARANHWHGSPWHYRVDGNDHVVTETYTNGPFPAPPPALATSSFTPSDVFTPPLSFTWPETKGADLLAASIPFVDSLSIGYGHTHYGTGYFIYETFPKGATNASQPIASWDEASVPQDVVDLVNRAGEDISPNTPEMTSLAGTAPIIAGTTTLFDVQGPAVLRSMTLTVADTDAATLGDARLRITWDDRPAPSIDAPLSLFFGTGSLFNPTAKEWLVKAFPVSVRFHDGKVTFAVYFPMPFFRTAHVELVSAAALPVDWSARTQPYTDPTNWVGYLHATYVDHGAPTTGVDLTFLDTTHVEGGGDWCGSFVGTSFVFSDRAVLTTLEGDPLFFFDDSQSPQVHGTGTEEWAGGGDYWGGLNATLPFYGHPVGAKSSRGVLARNDGVESAYRFLLADAMPFGKNAIIRFEHGAVDDSTEHYRSVAYWYGAPGACLVQTDALRVGDAADEAAHRYVSPDAAADSLTSSYEVGGPVTDTGRHTTGTTELSFAIAPQNFGVMLRRKLDVAFPDQTAEVWVAPDDGGCSTFSLAGIWYTAGSNSCVYSNPPGELDPFAPVVETADRRFHDDEFLIARSLTDGHSRIRVRFVFRPANLPITPEAQLPAQAWSEYHYTVYSWALPPPP